MLIHDADNHPASGAVVIANSLASCQSIGGNNDALMQRGAMRIERDLRHSLGQAGFTDGLADQQAPPCKAWVLAGRDDVAFNSGEEHKWNN